MDAEKDAVADVVKDVVHHSQEKEKDGVALVMSSHLQNLVYLT